MGFHESGYTPDLVTQTVNVWVADSISIPSRNIPKKGLLVKYSNEGKNYTEIIRDPQRLNAIYKICNSNPYCIFYLLTKIYHGQILYSDFIYFVEFISEKLNKVKETQQAKPEKERLKQLHKLEMEIRTITARARKTLRVTQ